MTSISFEWASAICKKGLNRYEQAIANPQSWKAIRIEACGPDMRESKFLRRNSELVEQVVKDGIVALQIENGRCYGFNETAARIWGLIDEEQSVDQLCAILETEFETDAKTCRASVERTIDLLDSEGLITWIST